MMCHVLSCAPPEMSCFVMVRRVSGAIATRPHPACRSSIAFRSVPFFPPPAPPQAAGPCFARIARLRRRGRARAFCAGARFAHLIAHTRTRGPAQGARFPSVPLSVIFPPARGEAAHRCRFFLLLSSYHGFLIYKPHSGIFSNFSERTHVTHLRPAATARTGRGATVRKEPRSGGFRAGRRPVAHRRLRR